MLNIVVPVISGYNPDEWADEGAEDQDDQDDGFVYVEDDGWGQSRHRYFHWERRM